MISSLVRKALLLVLASALFVASPAAATPIVISNTSYVFGAVSLLRDGVPVGTVDYYDSTEWATPPLSGSWNIAGSRAGTTSGSVFVASSTRGTISPTTFTGIGLTFQRASIADIPAGLGSMSWARSVHNVTFEVTSATPFSYDARYFGTTDGLYGAIVGRLESANGVPLFIDQFRSFQDLDETRSHSGVLSPGRYSLILVSDPLQLIAPGGTVQDGGFEFSMEFQPASEIPEPSTLLLLAGGLGLAWRRYRGARS